MLRSTLLAAAAFVCLTGAAMAQTAAPAAATAAPAMEAKGDGPCKQIAQACMQAGFVKGGHKDGATKGLKMDCMKPIMDGQAVAGVTVSPETVSACKEKRAKWMEMKKLHMGDKPMASPTAPGAAPVAPAVAK